MEKFDEILINGIFGEVKKGFYVNLASDNSFFDVTGGLYERDWRGVNIVTNQEEFKLVSINRPGDINLNIWIRDYNGILEDCEEEGVKGNKKGYKKELKECRSFDVILEESGVEVIDFLKISIEKNSVQVILDGLFLAGISANVIMIESLNGDNNISLESENKLLKNQGYELVYSSMNLRFYVLNVFDDLIGCFKKLSNLLNEMEELNLKKVLEVKKIREKNETKKSEKGFLENVVKGLRCMFKIGKNSEKVNSEILYQDEEENEKDKSGELLGQQICQILSKHYFSK
ncbi:MAG: hypothetical protein C5B43_05075 [Verrucomicrobia bacterium]|nr:MAG: hypothetical protein C5B43_05075 [Verrucomicrobiota bacterium]